MTLGNIKRNIILLTFSNLLISIVDFCFNIYLSRIYGSEGMGLLSIIGPINCFFLSFMTQGIVVTISKTSATYYQEHRYEEMNKTIEISLLASFVWSLFLVLVILFSAKPIALFFFGNKQLITPIIATCPLMILMSISNVLKGHFLGLQKIRIPALINITEKLLRFPILYFLIRFFLNRTALHPATLVYFCYALGELHSVFFLLLYYKKTKVSYRINRNISIKEVKEIIFPMIKKAFPICMTQCVLELANVFSSVIVKSRLCFSGYSIAETLSLMGKYNGMVLPLMTYPMVLIGSICSIAVPKISAMLSVGKKKGTARMINRVLSVSFLIGMITGIILWLFSSKLGILFYHQQGLNLMIKAGAFCVPVLYIAEASSSLLISLGEEVRSFQNNLLHQLILLIVLILFTGMPVINVYGYFIAIFISHLVLLLMNIHFLKLHQLY